MAVLTYLGLEGEWVISSIDLAIAKLGSCNLLRLYPLLAPHRCCKKNWSTQFNGFSSTHFVQLSPLLLWSHRVSIRTLYKGGEGEGIGFVKF